MRPRLAFFIRSLAGGGGAERVSVTLANGLAGRGYPVDLVLGRREGNFLDNVSPEVRLVDLGGRSWARTLGLAACDPLDAARLLLWGPPWIVGCTPGLVAYLREERPAALVSALNYTNLTALWAHRLAGVDTRLVVTEHNTLSRRAALGPGRLRSLPRKVRHFYPRASALAAVSDGVAEDLAEVMEVPRARIHTLYNPVVSPELEREAAAPLDHPWFAPGQPPVLLAVGKLRPQKDLATLLDAFAELRRRQELRLLVLGEGPLRPELEAQTRSLGVADDVSLPGFVKNPFAFMARSAAFVLSSRWEGLPTALIEAMACGCPVVATDCPSGPAEILDKGAFGPLAPVGDPLRLAAAIGSVLEAPPQRERLVERARFFSVEAGVDRYLELLVGNQ